MSESSLVREGEFHRLTAPLYPRAANALRGQTSVTRSSKTEVVRQSLILYSNVLFAELSGGGVRVIPDEVVELGKASEVDLGPADVKQQMSLLVNDECASMLEGFEVFNGMSFETSVNSALVYHSRMLANLALGGQMQWLDAEGNPMSLSHGCPE